ncbi:MAG: DUF2085 domain-containing protein [Candidatus Micrarchaeota archaeon]
MNTPELYARFPYLFYTALVAAFVASLFIVPYIEAAPGMEQTGKSIFILYRPMCHQLPERSFFVFGAQMPVCSRDIGIYGGMLLGALAFPFLFGMRSEKLLPLWVFIGAMIPIGLDGGIQFVTAYVPLPIIGTYVSNNPLRLATGLLMGAVMSFYAIPLLNGVWRGTRNDKKIDKKLE